jgi:hypothetical protein
VRAAAPFLDVLGLHGRVTKGLAAAAAALTLATVAVAGCGSSDDEGDASATAAWADGVCTAVSTWKGSLQSVGSTLRDLDQLSKAKLEQAANDVSDANAKLADDLDAVGKPPETGGDEAKAAVDNLAKALQGSADDIRDATKDVSSPSDVATAVNVASGALLSMKNDISATADTLNSLDSAETWKSAFADSDACRSLQS